MTLYNNNKQTIEWWKANFASANTWFEKSIGDSINVSLFDVMPNPRMFDNISGCEFEITESKSNTSDEPILVIIDQNSGVLVVEDGHHRLHNAFTLGQKRIDVIVVKKSNVSKMLFNKLSINF
jgi:hypothetical protein